MTFLHFFPLHRNETTISWTSSDAVIERQKSGVTSRSWNLQRIRLKRTIEKCIKLKTTLMWRMIKWAKVSFSVHVLPHITETKVFMTCISARRLIRMVSTFVKLYRFFFFYLKSSLIESDRSGTRRYWSASRCGCQSCTNTAQWATWLGALIWCECSLKVWISCSIIT